MMRTRSVLAIVLATLLLITARARADEDLDALVSRARSAVLDFTADPEMDWFRDHVKDAKGILIIPRLLKGGFIFGGSGGSGLLLGRDPAKDTWSNPAFYSLGSVTAGAQIGGEAAQVMMLIMTQRGFDSMMATSVKLGADVEVAAGPVGAGTKAATADVLAFSRTKGLFGGATVEGAWIYPRDGWNEEYYGRRVRPVEIMIEHKVSNLHAEPLREALAKVSGSAHTSTATTAPSTLRSEPLR